MSILASLPVELITLGVSTILGMISKNMEMKHEREMKRDELAWKDVENARKVTDKHIAWTRRIIAIMVIFSIIVLPKIVALIAVYTGTSVPMMVGYTESVGGLLSWFSGDSEMQFKTFSGLIITPLDTNLAAAIGGFYFGKSRR